jgi:hypothetical protein
VAYVGDCRRLGLVVCSVGAAVSHLRVGDLKGIGSAVFMLWVAPGALALRILTYKPDAL